MSLVLIVMATAAILGLAYWLYGGYLARIFKLDPDAKAPAVEMRDDVDYVPIKPAFLLGQHFSAIAAAGPIVGPIVAGIAFGWLPALLWILIGSIFIGGVHDFTSLVASIRHKARSITEVVRENMSRRAYLMFLGFIWIALIYIIIAFTDVTAQSFVGDVVLENGDKVLGGGIATSSMLYLALPVLMGLLLRFTRITVGWATLIFLPLVGVAIWVGQFMPISLDQWLAARFNMGPKQAAHTALKIWDVGLLSYCFIAGLLPMWMLLQPRGHLGGCFLYIVIIAGGAGLVVAGKPVQYPAFQQWTSASGDDIFPFLFITIACGACSGFHAIVSSGTSSKQLSREPDARIVGYGAMLLEALIAVVALGCVMMLAIDDPLTKRAPNLIYASGIGQFMKALGIPVAFGISFGLLAFATFVYDTLDICTRLGRYIIQELTGWHGRAGRWTATAIMAVIPLIFVLRTATDAKGNAIPVWKAFWTLFGASNQLLAALTLLGITVWLVRKHKARWIIWVTGIPMVFMYVMSLWALVIIVQRKVVQDNWWLDPVPWASIVLIGLAVMMLVEALGMLFRKAPAAV